MKKLIFTLAIIASFTSCKPDALDETTLAELEVSNEELRNYLDRFVEIGLDNGFDYTYVYKQPINLVFSDLSGTISGQSWGINKSKIDTYIDAEWYVGWKEKAEKRPDVAIYQNRLDLIIFHELSHDILNLKHKDNIGIMKTNVDYDSKEKDAVVPLLIDAMKFAKENKKKGGNEHDAELTECSFEFN